MTYWSPVARPGTLAHGPDPPQTHSSPTLWQLHVLFTMSFPREEASASGAAREIETSMKRTNEVKSFMSTFKLSKADISAAECCSSVIPSTIYTSIILIFTVSRGPCAFDSAGDCRPSLGLCGYERKSRAVMGTGGSQDIGHYFRM